MKGDFSDKLALSDSSLFNSVLNMSCFYRVERAFHKLVEDMMYFDLSLRTEVENAELLIFPSILLPIQCRSESHLYLYYFFQWHISNLLFVKQNCVGLLLQDFKKSTTCGVSSEQRNHHCKNGLVCGGELTSIEKTLNPLETTESLQDRGLVVVLVQLIQCLYPFFI